MQRGQPPWLPASVMLMNSINIAEYWGSLASTRTHLLPSFSSSWVGLLGAFEAACGKASSPRIAGSPRSAETFSFFFALLPTTWQVTMRPGRGTGGAVLNSISLETNVTVAQPLNSLACLNMCVHMHVCMCVYGLAHFLPLTCTFVLISSTISIFIMVALSYALSEAGSIQRAHRAPPLHGLRCALCLQLPALDGQGWAPGLPLMASGLQLSCPERQGPEWQMP